MLICIKIKFQINKSIFLIYKTKSYIYMYISIYMYVCKSEKRKKKRLQQTTSICFCAYTQISSKN